VVIGACHTVKSVMYWVSSLRTGVEAEFVVVVDLSERSGI